MNFTKTFTFESSLPQTHEFPLHGRNKVLKFASVISQLFAWCLINRINYIKCQSLAYIMSNSVSHLVYVHYPWFPLGSVCLLRGAFYQLGTAWVPIFSSDTLHSTHEERRNSCWARAKCEWINISHWLLVLSGKAICYLHF